MTQARRILVPPAYRPLRDADAVFELLREQAAQMHGSTGGVIEAEVERAPGPGDRLTLKFTLLVPAMDGYRYNLFRVIKGLDDFPVELVHGDQRATLATMPELEAALLELFASAATKATIGKLITLAEAQS